MAFDPADLRSLADAALDSRLSAEQTVRLEHLVLSDPAAARWYADYARLDAAVRLAAADSAFLKAPPAQPSWLARRRAAVAAVAGAGLAAGVLLGFGYFRAPEPPVAAIPSDAIASLADTKACLWEAGTLPTAAGANLGPGRLRLAEGLARVRFASGAEVTLEGPADLELVSAMRCVLHRGQVTATVPPPAVGFVIDTPQSRVTDFGTEFGVTVRDGGTADVFVFNGRVDVLHRPTGKTEPLKGGARRRFTADGVVSLDPKSDMGMGDDPPVVVPEAGRTVRLSTAVGRGRDAFVLPIPIPDDRRSDTLLQVKRSKTMPDWHRKAYFTIDLSGIDPADLTAADLTLTFAPTGMGYAALVPDATFTLYGLTDERQDVWGEGELRWGNAPANRPGPTELDPAQVVRVGEFVIRQGEQTGTRTVTGPELLAFLRRDTNRLATFILVRETAETANCGLVHGFASRRHPTLPPPTLRLTVGK